MFNIPNIAIATGDYYQSKMTAAQLGFENISSLIDPVRQPPEDLLNICRGELAVRKKLESRLEIVANLQN